MIVQIEQMWEDPAKVIDLVYPTQRIPCPVCNSGYAAYTPVDTPVDAPTLPSIKMVYQANTFACGNKRWALTTWAGYCEQCDMLFTTQPKWVALR